MLVTEGIFINKSIREADFLQLAKALWIASQSDSLATAFWRLPYQNCIHFISDFSKENEVNNFDIENFGEGFVCHPFLEDEENKKSFFIKSDLHLKWESGKLSDFDIEKIENLEGDYFKNLLFNLENKIVNEETSSILSNINDTNVFSEEEKLNFINLVENGINAINEGQFQKVVLSRQKKIYFPSEFNPLKAFQQLCDAYPHAFISLVYLPNQGTWLGASPEILVSVDKNEIFRTVALAGTQAYNKDISSNHARWSMKEIEEQALVSRYIVNCFKKIRVREYIETGPKTVVAGNLMHLRTDFSIDTKAFNFNQLPSIMLSLLHPTSAVCGVPKESALEFIKNNEIHGRDLYSGYLGPVNIDVETHLFVNLRCIKLEEVFDYDKITKTGILFAGAGVTAQSDPEREWIETELKYQTILNIIL